MRYLTVIVIEFVLIPPLSRREMGRMRYWKINHLGHPVSYLTCNLYPQGFQRALSILAVTTYWHGLRSSQAIFQKNAVHSSHLARESGRDPVIPEWSVFGRMFRFDSHSTLAIPDQRERLPVTVQAPTINVACLRKCRVSERCGGNSRRTLRFLQFYRWDH